MMLTVKTAVPLLVLSYLAAPLSAQQQGPYVRFSVGAARVEAPGEHFQTDPVFHPSFALGYGLRKHHAVELRASYLEAQTTERIPEGAVVDAPFTVGVRAVPLGIAYQYRLPSPTERVYPLVAFGAVWARIVDTWESDTPMESRSASVYGLDASLNLVAKVTGPASVVTRGGYRSTRGSGERHVQSIGLSGPFADVGLQFQW